MSGIVVIKCGIATVLNYTGAKVFLSESSGARKCADRCWLLVRWIEELWTGVKLVLECSLE